jgi:hypothetical protein
MSGHDCRDLQHTGDYTFNVSTDYGGGIGSEAHEAFANCSLLLCFSKSHF